MMLILGHGWLQLLTCRANTLSLVTLHVSSLFLGQRVKAQLKLIIGRLVRGHRAKLFTKTYKIRSQSLTSEEMTIRPRTEVPTHHGASSLVPEASIPSTINHIVHDEDSYGTNAAQCLASARTRIS